MLFTCAFVSAHAKMLHGGFSGSFVLQIFSVSQTGVKQASTVVKLDKAECIYGDGDKEQGELVRMEQALKYFGDNAPKGGGFDLTFFLFIYRD